MIRFDGLLKDWIQQLPPGSVVMFEPADSMVYSFVDAKKERINGNYHVNQNTLFGLNYPPIRIETRYRKFVKFSPSLLKCESEPLAPKSIQGNLW